MGGSKNGNGGDRTDIFDSRRNDVVAPQRGDDDTFSEFRAPRASDLNQNRRTGQDMTFRTDDGRTIHIENSNVTIINGGMNERGYERVGGGRNSYCPNYDSMADSRGAFRHEQMLNSSRGWDQLNRIPIPDCFGHQQGRFQERGGFRCQSQRLDPRYSIQGGYNDGPMSAVSANDFDVYNRGYDRYDRDRYDDRDRGGFSNGLRSVGRFFNDLFYAARPLIQGYAQIKMAENGWAGGGWNGGWNGGYNNNYYRGYQNRNYDYPGVWSI
jgi:hypothetical protein